ncbi:hypothetical protein [Microbacterium resistens]
MTAPVELPELVPGRGWYLAGVITGGVLLALNVALGVWAVMVR